MGISPHKKTAPSAAPLFNGPLSTTGLFISFILDMLTGIFHVLTKAMCCVASGENYLADNGDQETEGRSF